MDTQVLEFGITQGCMILSLFELYFLLGPSWAKEGKSNQSFGLCAYYRVLTMYNTCITCSVRWTTHWNMDVQICIYVYVCLSDQDWAVQCDDLQHSLSGCLPLPLSDSTIVWLSDCLTLWLSTGWLCACVGSHISYICNHGLMYLCMYVHSCAYVRTCAYTCVIAGKFASSLLGRNLSLATASNLHRACSAGILFLSRSWCTWLMWPWPVKITRAAHAALQSLDSATPRLPRWCMYTWLAHDAWCTMPRLLLSFIAITHCSLGVDNELWCHMEYFLDNVEVIGDWTSVWLPTAGL